MMAPLFKTGLIGSPVMLALAVVVGVLFGFTLERSGMGDARKLTGVFMLKDFAVPRVMFVAIVVAMFGNLLLGATGAMDPALLYFSETQVVPMAIAGMLFGAGFVVGGYCPGTVLVAAANLKTDAFVFIAGVFGGQVIWGELAPGMKGFLGITDLGRATLPAVFHVHPGLAALGVVIFAFLFFGFARFAEQRWGEREVSS